MDRVRELERLLRISSQDLREARHALRSWRARNPDGNTALSLVAGIVVGAAAVLALAAAY